MATKKKVKKAAKEQVSSKDALKSANEALTTFLKKNKLARDEDHSKSKKFGKEYKELTLAVEKASESMDAGNEKVVKAKKETKEKSSGGSAGRAAKYDYPEGLTSAEKKEFRVKARKAEKGGSTKKADKATTKVSKSSKKEEAEEAPKSKSKGGKKEVAKVETKDIAKKKKKKVKKND